MPAANANGASPPPRSEQHRGQDELGALTLAEVVSRLHWLIHLRWLAAAGVVVLPLAAANVLGYALPTFPLALVGMGIAVYNLAFRAWLRRRGEAIDATAAARMANIQITVDLTALTVVLHLSGGVDNPLSGYYVFHVIIAATMLTPAAAFAQATWAVFLYSAMVAAEMYGLLPHHHLPLLADERLHKDPHAFLIVLALASVLYVSAYLACSIVQRLREREAELERMRREAHQTATQCQAAYDKLVEVQHTQVQYLRRVAHELKSPLAAISTAISVVLEGLVGDVHPKQREMLERIQRRCQDAIATVGDLLDLARMRELPPQQFEPVDLRHVIDAIEAAYAEDAAAKGISLQVEQSVSLPPVRGDMEALQTMLGNLVSNAVKYTQSGGQVIISAKPEDDMVVLSVADNGPGIAEEELPRIFDEFYRSPEMRRSDIEGTGLGLPIVKSIVEAHSGRIEVRSRRGEGTTFTVYLPAITEAASEGPPDS